MIKGIEIVDYTDLCSTAFVRSVDALYDRMYNESIDKIVINISNPQVKELFEFHMEREVNYITRHYGKSVILVGTCSLKNNWKGYNISVDHRLHHDRYLITDDSLLLNVKALTALLDRKWKELSDKDKLITLSFDNVDCDDIIKVITEVMGEQHIERYKTDFKIVEDINLIHFGISSEPLPNDVRDSITNELINYNLLI